MLFPPRSPRDALEASPTVTPDEYTGYETTQPIVHGARL